MRTNINRYDIFTFERLASKLFKSLDLRHDVFFTRSNDGVRISTSTNDSDLSFTISECEISQSFTLPWSFIKEVAAKKHDTLTLEIQGSDISATYSLGGVPQHRTFPLQQGFAFPVFPSLKNSVTFPNTIFDALQDASKCVDPDNARYSLGAICLRGERSQIMSTDGRQALMQDGFAFPWDHDVLCPVSKVFGAKELRDNSTTVNIGFENEKLCFEAGNIAFSFSPIEGKFPRLERFTDNNSRFSWLDIDQMDADFVAQRLDNMPGKSNSDSPIYIELNGHVSVRGHDTVQSSATDLRLVRSRYEGKPVVMSMNRKYLKNALNFRVNRIGFDPDENSPIVAYGDRKTFVIMPLEINQPEVASEQITVLASDAVSTKQSKPKLEVQKPQPVKTSEKPKSKGQLLEEAEKLREALRVSLVGVNGLIREIKSQKRHDKLLRDTVASLRKLQGV